VSLNNDIMVTQEMEIINKMGLHARPAMQFVDLANKFTSRITVCKKNQCVNAKSIMELLLLAAARGTVLTVKAEGPDADKAIEALAKLVEGKFGEE
jgi:phosphocarrier protein HPr